MSRLWKWLAGIGICAAIGGVVASLFGRGRSVRGELDMARDRAERAREQAQAELDEAVRRGVESVREADAGADEEVTDVLRSHDLSSYLLEHDPGPKTDDG